MTIISSRNKPIKPVLKTFIVSFETYQTITFGCEVEVQASSEEEAERLAWIIENNGDVVWREHGEDTADAELIQIEEQS